MNTGPQGVIKVWTEMFITDMQYVSLLVSHEATACDVVEMVLEKSNVQEDPECYRICEVNHEKNGNLSQCLAFSANIRYLASVGRHLKYCSTIILVIFVVSLGYRVCFGQRRFTSSTGTTMVGS